MGWVEGVGVGEWFGLGGVGVGEWMCGRMGLGGKGMGGGWDWVEGDGMERGWGGGMDVWKMD